MTNFVWSAIIFAAILSFLEAYSTFDFGNGIIHKLEIVQDVTLERTTNMDYLEYLLIARLTAYPLKRSLVQFENLSSACPLNEIQYAKMYLYFAYAHRASFRSMEAQPYLKHTFQVYRVLKPWKEQEATIEYRQRGLKWDSTLLNIGTDTVSEPQCEYSEGSKCSPTTLYPPRPSGYMEFDVTKAIRNWRNGSQNFGLLVKVINEAENGRGIRFYSKSHSDSRQHPFINVLCKNRTTQEIQKDKKEEKETEEDEEVEKEEGSFTKNGTKINIGLEKERQNFTKNVIQIYIGGAGCSQNSDFTHSKPFWFHSFNSTDLTKIYIGGAECSQNSDATHSKPFWSNFFFNAIFASLYLMRL